MKTIRVGSRESRLAVVQSELVMDAIRAAHPEVGLELVTMKTTGDKILDRTLDKVGGKGLFVKELDAALLDGRVDLTVHSCKDLPMEEDPRIPLAGFSRREDPRDVLVLPQGAEELDPSRPIGCASARRAVQLRALFPGVAVAPVRGNVLTRLRKLDEGQFSALVLATKSISKSRTEDHAQQAPGLEPSMVIKLSLSMLGGKLPPGQCITSVFLPALAVTLNNGSAFKKREEKAPKVTSLSSSADKL